MTKNYCRIKALKDCTTKLAFVKHIKFNSDLGLKESKDIVDTILEKPYKFVKVEILPGTDMNEFRKGLDELGWVGDSGANYQMDGDLQWKRNFTLLKLGAASKEEYSDFILESLLSNIGDTEQVLRFALNKLSKEDLIETINLYNINEYLLS